MERDSNGRFVQGNQAAKGNKGNKKPKWGNSNAVTSGQYIRYSGLSERDGFVYVIADHYSVGVLDPNQYYIDNGQIYVSDELAASLVNNFHLNEQSFRRTDKSDYKRYWDTKASIFFRNTSSKLWIVYMEDVKINIIKGYGKTRQE